MIDPHWLDHVTYMDYEFRITGENEDFPYLQASYLDKDIVTGRMERQYTRKWRLYEQMTKSQVIQTAFKCALTSAEHRCREHFRYKGSAVYSPHYDVDALEQLCKAKRFEHEDEKS